MTSKTIIVTGATKGIGLAVAKYLLEAVQEFNVVVLGRDQKSLKKIQAERSDRVRSLAGDLSDFSLAQKAVDLAISAFGRLDGLVINHGTLGQVSKIADCDISAFQSTMNINFISAVALVKAAIPVLRKTKGRIIMTSSGAAVHSYSGWGAYGASKAALNSLTMALGVEEPDIVTVAIRPGVVDTDMQSLLRGEAAEAMAPKDREKFADLKKNNQLLPPEKPAYVIARLSVGATPDLGGKFLSWNDESLKEFQD